MYVALPPAAPAPGIVLLPPIFGIEPVIRELADRYAARGFAVMVPNQFRRDADPDVMDRTESGRARAQERMKRVDVDQAVDDLRATIDELRALPECNGKSPSSAFASAAATRFSRLRGSTCKPPERSTPRRSVPVWGMRRTCTRRCRFTAVRKTRSRR